MILILGFICSFEFVNRCNRRISSFLELVMFIIKFDIFRFGVKGLVFRIELVSKYKILGFNL